ncbi:hypothetical protein OHA77_39640 [Streptosporangium sp. NBC_01639]|nr:hypothetical protein OHA77_39640 [Streptosporangium sp. NBC_01639]
MTGLTLLNAVNGVRDLLHARPLVRARFADLGDQRFWRTDLHP